MRSEMLCTRRCRLLSVVCAVTGTAAMLVYMMGDQHSAAQIVRETHRGRHVTNIGQQATVNRQVMHRGSPGTADSRDQISETLQRVKILCWVTTTLRNLKTRTHFVKDTWGKRCDILLFFGSQADKNFPVIQLAVPDGRGNLARKTELALQYVYEHYRDKAEWFLKADDDTYVIVDNLKYFLFSFNASKGLYFGFTYSGKTPQGYNSGGAGYVLSQEALRRYYIKGSKSKMCPIGEATEDVVMGKCMYRLGVKNVNTLDERKRTRFHAYPPLTHIDASDPNLRWRSFWGYKTGAQSISTMPFTFHYIRGNDMRLVEFLIYHIRHISGKGTVLL